MEVVDVADAVNLPENTGDFLGFQLVGSALHEHVDALAEGDSSGPHDDERKDAGANRVEIPELRPREDAGGGQNDANRVEQVPKDVEVGGLHVNVALLLCFLLGVFLGDGESLRFNFRLVVLHVIEKRVFYLVLFNRFKR
jgi:hypothetical protein